MCSEPLTPQISRLFLVRLSTAARRNAAPPGSNLDRRGGSILDRRQHWSLQPAAISVSRFFLLANQAVVHEYIFVHHMASCPCYQAVEKSFVGGKFFKSHSKNAWNSS